MDDVDYACDMQPPKSMQSEGFPKITGKEKAVVYDYMRKCFIFAGYHDERDAYVVTQTVIDLKKSDISSYNSLIEKVALYDNFDKDKNDPYEEHDFGTVLHEGLKYHFKFDDNGGFNGLRYILTILRSDEL